MLVEALLLDELFDQPQLSKVELALLIQDFIVVVQVFDLVVELLNFGFRRSRRCSVSSNSRSAASGYSRSNVLSRLGGGSSWPNLGLGWCSLPRSCYLVAAHDVVHILAISPGNRIVLVPTVMEVIVLLKPLAELEIVLVFGLDQLLHIDYLLDAILFKRDIQDFEVVNVLVVKLGLPVHFRHVEGARIDLVDYHAVDSSSCALLDFRQLQLHSN